MSRVFCTYACRGSAEDTPEISATDRHTAGMCSDERSVTGIPDSFATPPRYPARASEVSG